MTTINIPQTDQIETKSTGLTVLMNQNIESWGGKIKTKEAYERAGEIRSNIKSLQKQVKETFAESKSLANKLHKSITATEGRFLNPLLDAETQLNRMMGNYVLEQRHIANELARKEREDAERKALEQAKIEKERIEKERVEQAAQMEALGFRDEAEAIIQTPVEVPVVCEPVIDSQSKAILESTKNEFVGHRTDFDFEIVDEAILPREYLMVDDKKIRRVVKALGKDCKIAGVRVIEKIIMNSRRG